MDTFEVLNTLRRENIFEWVGVHPQLCAEDGDRYLKELLKGAEIDELYVAACDPTMQRKMFRDAFDGAGSVSYTHLRAHETRHDLVCRLLLEKKKKKDHQIRKE